MINFVFEGIDFWSRPVFRQVGGDMRIGSVEKLCSTMEEVEQLTESDMVYFGNTFDEDDPVGTPIDPKKFRIFIKDPEEVHDDGV